MKIAIMQPYFCPHIGYFQLVDSVDTFVFYDDVQYIKRGYINRNELKNEYKFTVPVSNASTKRKINEVNVSWNNPFFKKFKTAIEKIYCKSINYNEVVDILDDVFSAKPTTISDLAIDSVIKFSKYIGITTTFLKSSDIDFECTVDKSMNLINICKTLSCDHYINSIGGQKLYDKDFFFSNGIKLNFLSGRNSKSIIDEVFDQPVDKYLESLRATYKLI